MKGLNLVERVRRWCRIRRWRPDDHSDCLSFLGPCNLCREYSEYHRKPPPTARTVLR